MPSEKPPDFFIDAEPLKLIEEAIEDNKYVQVTQAAKRLYKTGAGIRAKEAADVLSWLSENRCLDSNALRYALAAIKAGDHRR